MILELYTVFYSDFKVNRRPFWFRKFIFPYWRNLFANFHIDDNITRDPLAKVILHNSHITGNRKQETRVTVSCRKQFSQCTASGEIPHECAISIAMISFYFYSFLSNYGTIISYLINHYMVGCSFVVRNKNKRNWSEFFLVAWKRRKRLVSLVFASKWNKKTFTCETKGSKTYAKLIRNKLIRYTDYRRWVWDG